MKLWDWIKSFARILKSEDLQQYTCEDLVGIIVAGATENPLAAKDTIIKTVNNILLLPNAFFWDRMYRFLCGTFFDFKDQIKMANKFEADSDNYARFVKKQINIINQIEDDEKVDYFARLTRAFLLDCIKTQELYFKLAKFLMLCTSDELKFLEECEYTFASPLTVMISALYQFGLFNQSTDEKGEPRYVLSDFAKSLKQNSLNFYQEMHGIPRLGAYEVMQPLAIPELLSANAFDKMFGDTEIILNGGTAAGYNETERAVKQGLSLPAVKKVVDREVEKNDAKIAEVLSDI